MNPSPLTMWLLVLLAALTALQAPNTQLLPPLFLLPLGIIAWIGLSAWAYAHHRQAPRRTSDVQSLVTSGPYAHIRHPFYTADILLALTAFLSYPRLDVLLAVIAATTIWVVWAVREERALAERFPEYESYREETGRFLPRP